MWKGSGNGGWYILLQQSAKYNLFDYVLFG